MDKMNYVHLCLKTYYGCRIKEAWLVKVVVSRVALEVLEKCL